MRKREFIRKAGLLSASMLVVPSMGFGRKSSNINPMVTAESKLNVQIKLVIGSDHAGFSLKGLLVKLLQSWDYSVKDVGSFTPDPVDFPDIALLLADEIKTGRAERGIMVCGTGVGAAIACNKIQGIRAALCHDTYSAHQCVEHDNVNVLCIGAQIIGPSIAEEILTNFLNAKFSTEEQFRRRVRKLDQFDMVLPEK
ncbi:MAG TPA: RpiB/LacA/LacB family sugar-phosphate isomerase [Bacteroidales bacterium]|nr:RpiB/LacA/LacB family sugar-phosphate isomerase [Bacteroidales bacterium]